MAKAAHNSNQVPVRPVVPPAAWVGGKSRLAPIITSRIEAVQHALYAEPFVGMGGVFFRRKLRPKAEAINDYSGELVNLFRVLQRHYKPLMQELRFHVSSRREFERLTNTDPTVLTDLERAARFIYLQRTAYGGRPSGQNYVADVTRSRFNLTRIGPVLEKVFERLSGVVIENLDWCSFMERYDRGGTLFYVDPPYWGCENLYGKKLFSRDQFSQIAKTMSRIKGKAILSLNDCDDVRQTFAEFRMEPVKNRYTVGHVREVSELLIYSW